MVIPFLHENHEYWVIPHFDMPPTLNSDYEKKFPVIIEMLIRIKLPAYFNYF